VFPFIFLSSEKKKIQRNCIRNDRNSWKGWQNYFVVDVVEKSIFVFVVLKFLHLLPVVLLGILTFERRIGAIEMELNSSIIDVVFHVLSVKQKK
jgi:hypothetical protein